MKQKVLSLFLCALLGMGVALAQGRDNDPQRRQRQMEREAVDIAKELELDDPTTLWFSNLYVEYRTELNRIREEARRDMPRPERRRGGSETDEPGQMSEKDMKKLSDEDAEKLILGSFDRTEKELKLKRDYYPRFREKLLPSQMVKIFVRPQRDRGNGWNRDRQGGWFPASGEVLALFYFRTERQVACIAQAGYDVGVVV